MSSLRKKLIAGNWKMNKTAAEASSLLKDIRTAVGQRNDVEIVVCPPFTSLESAAAALENSVTIKNRGTKTTPTTKSSMNAMKANRLRSWLNIVELKNLYLLHHQQEGQHP